MEQLELPLEGPQPIQKWLHVWTEAERAARTKKPGCEARAKGRSDPVREEGEMENIKQLSFSKPVDQP